MQRRQFLITGTGAMATAGCTPPARPVATGRTFLVAHGAWSGGWSWKKMHPLLAATGDRLIVPTYTGLGEREHLATPDVTLETHIRDLLGVIRFEDLSQIVLVAHSYGGMVATGVADRVPERIRQIIYLDAFVPRHGQALVDLVPAEAKERMLAGVAAGDGWRAPPQPVPEDTPAEDVTWMQPLRIPHPMRCFDMPLELVKGDTRLPRSYVYALRRPAVDTFGPFAARARSEGWPYHEIDASHSPHVTAPEALAELLSRIAA